MIKTMIWDDWFDDLEWLIWWFEMIDLMIWNDLFWRFFEAKLAFFKGAKCAYMGSTPWWRFLAFFLEEKKALKWHFLIFWRFFISLDSRGEMNCLGNWLWLMILNVLKQLIWRFEMIKTMIWNDWFDDLKWLIWWFEMTYFEGFLKQN